MSLSKFVFSFLFLLFLFWFWPNFIHEPMHLFALQAQGIDGDIHFDLTHFPAQPFINKIGSIETIYGGLFFLLAPSLLSIVLLAGLYVSRRKGLILTHLILPVYLFMDLFLNVMGFWRPTSDFHFLSAFNPVVPNLIMLVVAIISITIININLHCLVQFNNVLEKNQKQSD